MILGLFVALLVSAGCQGGARGGSGSAATTFEIYNLRQIHGGTGLSDDERQTLITMVRDAVGDDIWYRSGSSVRVLDDAMTVRTTREGHRRIQDMLARLASLRRQ